MTRLEDITQGSVIKGIIPNSPVTAVGVTWYGKDALELTYKDGNGALGNEVLYRDREPELEVLTADKSWSFDGDAEFFRLVSEARRIQLAHLFDPRLAVHSSLIDPFPHQITAVYGEMLQRRPLRFLLADDPGAGKTIMTGLLIKELRTRGDVQRCLVICPGNLVEQWQDELYRRFHLPFEVMTTDKYSTARTGNWFMETPLAICRLDQLSRNEEMKKKLKETDWDLIVSDEAHKMSASFWNGEVQPTDRYRLGLLLSSITRHFLLLTATPHNGKEEDFQLFMSLLDQDRFEGRFKNGIHATDTSDLMRRMVKEDLYDFDGKPLFPERYATTVGYQLSEAEMALYQNVTKYVREEFNRAQQFSSDGRRRRTVGFAVTILQRRLASSPEAIYESLRRRRERLEKRCREEESSTPEGKGVLKQPPLFSEEALDDLEDAPEEEVENIENSVADQASAAKTIAELKAEIDTLSELERMALHVFQSRSDRKWDELSRLLKSGAEMFDAQGQRRKLIIFTEHRDTLNYLHRRITSLLGKPEAVVTIHGGLGRDERRNAQLQFTQNRDVEVLVATDAAGEGINLQRAHLMVNYDLPWNPNRLEQRFGRIHRIGQREKCHCWNMVAAETREGDVYQRLLMKIEREREALGGKVFDILGKITFGEKSLRDLLLEAILHGDEPDVHKQLARVVDNALDRDRLKALIEEHALDQESMDLSRIQDIREDMERAQAHRLQPHFIAAFFLQAFKSLGGRVREREAGRYEISHVPAAIKNDSHVSAHHDPVVSKYERITFEKSLVNVEGKPLADFVCPGHPLLDATINLTIQRHQGLLKQGTIFVDETDAGEEARVLVYLEHGVQDARTDKEGKRRLVSQRYQFVEITTDGQVHNAGPAPYLDYRPLSDDEKAVLACWREPAWLRTEMEPKAMDFAIQDLVPRHLREVKNIKEPRIDKIAKAVKLRLTTEIDFYRRRAQELGEQENAGKKNDRLNSGRAMQRAEDLENRLNRRLRELTQERQLSPSSPNVVGGAMILPLGLVARLKDGGGKPAMFARDTAAMEAAAMAAVMAAEQALGFEPRDVSIEKCGYDIESRSPGGDGHLRFIEVKGRVKGADTVTVTKNEILTALNRPEHFILAIVEVDGVAATPCYVRRPFEQEPDFAATSVNYRFRELLAMGGPPS